MTQLVFHDSDIHPQRTYLKAPRWMKFISPMSFIVVFFIGLVTYQSLVDIYPPPIQTGAATATARTGPLGTVVSYSREVRIEEPVVVTIYRSLNCTGFPTFDFPETTRRYDEGSRTSHRTLVVPYRIPLGTQCSLVAGYSYKPTFSIPWHYVSVPTISLIVKDLQ